MSPTDKGHRQRRHKYSHCENHAQPVHTLLPPTLNTAAASAAASAATHLIELCWELPVANTGGVRLDHTIHVLDAVGRDAKPRARATNAAAAHSTAKWRKGGEGVGYTYFKTGKTSNTSKQARQAQTQP